MKNNSLFYISIPLPLPILMLVFVFIAWKLNAEEINLPGKDDKVYSALDTRAYNLKIKLKSKIIEPKVYWQEKINWQEEIRNWKTGLIVNQIIPPIIIDKENFYTEEEDFFGRYFWMKDRARLLVLNPLDSEVKCKLEFLANSYKKERNLEIFINGKAINTIKVPTKEEFSKIEIKDISLIPGINKIEFHCLEGTDKLKSDLGEKEGKIRQVSIKFKEFRFKDLKVSEATEVKGNFDNLRIVSQDNFLDLIFLPNRPIILSRDLGIDLEEFPFFNFEVKLLREVETKVIIALGIDYTGEGTIDDYLNLEEFGEHNLFELAKEKWQEVNEYENNFVIKKVVLLVYPKEEKASKIGILRLKNFNFYNDNSLILVRCKQLGVNQLLFENINVNSEVIERDGTVNVISYFDGALLSEFKEEKSEDFSEKEKIKTKKREDEAVKIRIPLEDEELRKFPFFSFKYILDNSDIQEIKPAVLIREDDQDRLIDLDENLYDKSDKTIEINLKNFKDIKAIILRVRRKDDADCSLPEKQGWYSFQLSEIKFYEKFPYPLKEKQLKEKFLNLLQETNPELVKIDEQVFRINDFEDLKSFESLEGETLVKKINLSKGNHKYEKLENPTFDIEWTVLELASEIKKQITNEPEITFKKINPTKYLVEMNEAKEPFWLVFSESFHKDWKIYRIEDNEYKMEEEINADYPNLKVKEDRHLMKFTPEDIRYLFKKPLDAEHLLVNGYANGWYIEPKKINLPEEFSLVIYFFPQSLFYLGLGISGLTFLGCIVYLIWPKKRKKQYEK